MLVSDTAAAIEALGRADPHDWKLDPEAHARLLPARASALSRLLGRPDVQDIAREFKSADAEAVVAQARYRRLGRLGIWLRLLALSIGAVSLVASAGWFPAEVRNGMTAVQAIVFLASIAIAYWISKKHLFRAWMTARSAAELARGRYFDAIAAADGMTYPNEIALLPLQLEYLRRYHLDVQSAYFDGRSAQLLESAERTNVTRWLVFALFVIVAGVLFMVFGTPEQVTVTSDEILQRVFIAVMTIASAFQVAYADIALIELNEHNAAHYKGTSNRLKELHGQPLEDAREAAAAGDKARVLAFAKSLQDELSNEHRAWALLRDIAPKPGD